MGEPNTPGWRGTTSAAWQTICAPSSVETLLMKLAECRRGRPRASGRGRCSALIAGADAPIRQLVRTVLEIGGFRVVEAGSSFEVRERLAAAERPPRVIVVDVSL